MVFSFRCVSALPSHSKLGLAAIKYKSSDASAQCTPAEMIRSCSSSSTRKSCWPRMEVKRKVGVRLEKPIEQQSGVPAGRGDAVLIRGPFAIHVDEINASARIGASALHAFHGRARHARDRRISRRSGASWPEFGQRSTRSTISNLHRTCVAWRFQYLSAGVRFQAASQCPAHQFGSTERSWTS